MAELLRLEGINKHFGGVIAGDNITFSVSSGKIYGLIGPNGAGKSTLLNMISGILDQDSGSIYFEGKDISHMPPHNRARLGIGRTFQTPHFIGSATLDVGLRAAMDLRNCKTGFFRSFFTKQDMSFYAELEEYMLLAGFEVDLNDDAENLPYGQLKILEIVRAMLAHPKLMLVDEPCAGLNDKEKQNVIALLKKAAYEMDMCVVLIEHSMDMVMSLCEDIIVLSFGKVIAHGDPESVSSNEEVITAYLGREDDD